MILREILNSIESAAPLSYQESWDNSGMQVGNAGADIRAVLLTTDVTEAVVAEAVAKKCQLIISHHPLLFHGLKQLCGLTPQQRIVEMAIRHDIAIYSAHTSMDSVPAGVSGEMAARLGLTDCRILVPAADSDPSSPHGLGIIGTLPAPVAYADFLQQVKDCFRASYVRYTAPRAENIRTVALCGGAGQEFTEEAIRQGADVYLTADCKYHEMQAAAGRIGLIDIDHWASEQFTRDIFARLLRELADKSSTPLAIHIAEADSSPVMVL